MKNKKQVIENLARCIYGVSSMRIRVDDINGEEAETPEKQDGGGDT